MFCTPSRDLSTSLWCTSSAKSLRIDGFKKWFMRNITKTDINRPGSTSQQEWCQERQLQAARNCRQARLNAKTQDQRQARLEAVRETTAERRQQTSEVKEHKRRQKETAEERDGMGLSQGILPLSIDFGLAQLKCRRLA